MPRGQFFGHREAQPDSKSVSYTHLEPFLEPGLPESFNVLVKELQSLGLDVELVKSKD